MVRTPLFADRRSRNTGLATSVAVACLSLIPHANAHAQLAELQQGTAVRVQGQGIAGRMKGIVVSRTADSVTFARASSTPITVPIAVLTTVEVSRGKSRGAGAVRGLLWGAGIGGALGFVPTDDPYCEVVPDSPSCLTTAESVVSLAIGGGLLGAGIGALIGRERWSKMTMAPRVTVLPLTHGVGVRVAMR